MYCRSLETIASILPASFSVYFGVHFCVGSKPASSVCIYASRLFRHLSFCPGCPDPGRWQEGCRGLPAVCCQWGKIPQLFEMRGRCYGFMRGITTTSLFLILLGKKGKEMARCLYLPNRYQPPFFSLACANLDAGVLHFNLCGICCCLCLVTGLRFVKMGGGGKSMNPHWL